jgi:hypothetical protein
MTTEDVSMAEALGLTEEDWHLLSRTSRTGNHRKRSCESLVSDTEELPTPEAKRLEKEQILTDKTRSLARRSQAYHDTYGTYAPGVSMEDIAMLDANLFDDGLSLNDDCRRCTSSQHTEDALHGLLDAEALSISEEEYLEMTRREESGMEEWRSLHTQYAAAQHASNEISEPNVTIEPELPFSVLEGMSRERWMGGVAWVAPAAVTRSGLEVIVEEGEELDRCGVEEEELCCGLEGSSGDVCLRHKACREEAMAMAGLRV